MSLLCVLKVVFQNVPGVGDECSGEVPYGSVILPEIKDFKVLRLQCPEGDMIMLQ